MKIYFVVQKKIYVIKISFQIETLTYYKYINEIKKNIDNYIKEVNVHTKNVQNRNT